MWAGLSFQPDERTLILYIAVLSLYRVHFVLQRQGTLFRRSAQHLQRSQVGQVLGRTVTESIGNSQLVTLKKDWKSSWVVIVASCYLISAGACSFESCSCVQVFATTTLITDISYVATGTLSLIILPFTKVMSSLSPARSTHKIVV